MTTKKAAKTDFLELANYKALLLLLDQLKINYSVFDISGNYIAQNETMTFRVSDGKTNAYEIDPASWAHCQLVMAKGKTVIMEEPYEDKTYLSVKQPIYHKGRCLGIIVLSYDVTEQGQSKASLKKIAQFKLMAGRIANEMQTPLAILNMGVNSLKCYLTPLIQAYQTRMVQDECQHTIVHCQLTDLHRLPKNFEQCLNECSRFVAKQLSRMNSE